MRRSRPVALHGARLTVRLACVLGAACWTTTAAPAHAQRWLLDTGLGVATGLEAGAAAEGVAVQRARTQFWAALEGRVDERPEWGYAGRAFVELERALGVGAEFGVVHQLRPPLRLFAGAVWVLAPESLFGATLRVHYSRPLLDGARWVPWIGVSVLPAGSDLPEPRGGLVWLHLGVGVESSL